MTGILNILAGSIAAAIKDGYFNLVTLLLPGNGTNGAQNNTFLDSSSNNFTITRNGNTTQGTFSPFSQTGWSNYFNAAYLSAGTSSDFSFAGNFTIEMWYYSTVTTDQSLILMGSSPYFAINVQAGTGYSIYLNNATPSFSPNNIIPQANTWNHVAIVRSGSTVTVYHNGTALSTTATNSSTLGYSGQNFNIGWSNANAYISNLRVVNGTAVYTSNFTPSTTQLTAITNTKLLTCQSNRFADANTQVSAKTISVAGGSPSVQAFSPFAPTAAYSAATHGASGYFDGSGDYLTVADNAALELGSSDFTIEWWQYNTSSASSSPLSKDAPTGTRAWGITVINDGTLTFYIPGGSQVITSTTGTWKVNAWNFFTITRSGSTIYLSINGTVQSFSWTSTIPNTADNIYIGAQNGPGSISSYVTGYLAGIRLVIGESVSTYRANFTVPTVPPTTTSNSVTAANTKLLTNFTNAGIFDATAKNDLETVGNAQISTTQSKFGGSSMYFDGTGDYLANYSDTTKLNTNFRSGDFTIEFWVYHAAAGSNEGYCDSCGSTTTGASGQWYIYKNNSNKVLFGQHTVAAYITSTGSISATTWTHIAVCRSGTTTRLFINGTQDGSTTTAPDFNAAGGLQIGLVATPYYLNGYIDDLRITKYARYVSNFSVPTAPFPLS